MTTDRDPVAVYQTIAREYADRFFDDRTDQPYVDAFLQQLKEGSHILDVGCGPGNWARYFADKGYAVEGIDMAEGMIAIAQERVPGARFCRMDLRNLGYPGESFDGLFASYSFFHQKRSQTVQTLAEFNRILVPGGLMYLSVQEGSGSRRVVEPFHGRKLVINLYSPEELRHAVESAGFDVFLIDERTPIESELQINKLFLIGKKKIS